MRICTNCGTTNTASVRVCKNCGSAIKSVNSVVVRTQYRKNKKHANPSDFNPVQHLQKTTDPQQKVLQSITPNITNLEYKFHSPAQNQNGLPLKSISPTPVEELVIPQPIHPKSTNSVVSPQMEESNPIILSDNTIRNEDLNAIPQNLPRAQPKSLQSVSVPSRGVVQKQNSNTHPIMGFSSQSAQSQQIEHEMTNVMSVLQGTPKHKPTPRKSLSSQATKPDLSIPNSLNDILINLSQLDLNIEAPDDEEDD